MKLVVLVAGLLFWMTPMWGQYDFNGAWRGKITQNVGGFRPSYEFEVYIIQEGNKITGRTYVYYEDNYAIMKMSGKVINKNKVLLTESKIVDFKKVEGMEWCLKKTELWLSRQGTTWRLEGPWEGATTFGACVPGKIKLKKRVPQA